MGAHITHTGHTPHLPSSLFLFFSSLQKNRVPRILTYPPNKRSDWYVCMPNAESLRLAIMLEGIPRNPICVHARDAM